MVEKSFFKGENRQKNNYYNIITSPASYLEFLAREDHKPTGGIINGREEEIRQK
jgi:hypothetical protein